ncbi:low specificity L-threonine aldolase [Paenibacillus sp. MSJ-34]|uniref:threonine aldolase family protein n=1 Tax=Paenibacillus sp. MSJ-34 TaxID=2841529 RepID=UPI001C0F4A0E|nr:beta-eliminating lyase-related protein [Paenibacillus sp. MSJ-34]MBU5444459.1 DegT/DnrJ/EryC1/StrS family aminotransferase [Paenibacillus sp. MSJ-34]
MDDNMTLSAAFKQALYPVGGNGKRNVRVLQEAFEDIDGSVESDIYGKGELIEDFQRRMANYVGKEAAVFFPSGTMAQQIALRMWCDRQGLRRVAYHPLCHLEIHEEDGLKELHRIEPILLADKTRLITLEDVMNMREDVACLLLELPQREIGGQLPDYRELEAISAYCREQGIKLHLDGARLFEITPYYNKSAAEICQLFDSVYVSFYKGIGGIAGAVLAGEEPLIQESKVWKRRYGGDLISLYPYIVSADYYFKLRIQKMDQYYHHAQELAGLYNQCYGVVTKPVEPVSNMFHVHIDLPREQLEPILISIYEETGIGLTSYLHQNDEKSCSYEISIGDSYANLPKDQLKLALQMLDEKLGERGR